MEGDSVVDPIDPKAFILTVVCFISELTVSTSEACCRQDNVSFFFIYAIERFLYIIIKSAV